MHPFEVFAKGIDAAIKRDPVAEAVRKIVASYYERHADATKLDPEFEDALYTVYAELFLGKEVPENYKFEEIVKKD